MDLNATDQRSPKRPHGFTILEFVISMLVVAALASWLIPAYFGKSSVTLKSAAELLEQDLKIARTLAMTEQQDLELIFDQSSYELRVVQDGEILIHPRNGRDFRVDFSRDAVFQGIGALRLDLDAKDRVQLSHMGYFSSGGSIVIPFGNQWRSVSLDVKEQSVRVSPEQSSGG